MSNRYLSEWVLWGGIPYRRGEVYAEMGRRGVTAAQSCIYHWPTIPEDQALAIREQFAEAGLA